MNVVAVLIAFDGDEASADRHRRGHVLDDSLAGRVVPVVENPLQEIDVRRRFDLPEEIALDELDPVGKPMDVR